MFVIEQSGIWEHFLRCRLIENLSEARFPSLMKLNLPINFCFFNLNRWRAQRLLASG